MNSSPLHLLHVFPTFAVGGAQIRFSQLVAQHGSRYRHTVIALDNDTGMASRITLDAKVEYCSVKFDKKRSVLNAALFNKTIASFAPDSLVTYNWGAIEWAFANRFGADRKHVHIEDGFGSEEARRQLLRRVWMRRLALSGQHTTVILPSRGLEKIALEVWKLPPQRIRFIPNGVDCERFSVEVESRKRRSGPLIIGTLASLRREKNVARLIKAFCAIMEASPNSDFGLLIVGAGPELAALETLARSSSYADGIRFAGATRKPELWYAQMDVFALSSDTEQMPLSLLEAMAAGLPVVSPAVGDVPSLVSSENASLISPADDESAFRRAIVALLSDSDLRLTLGAANQRKARAEFDERLMAKRYADVFG